MLLLETNPFQVLEGSLPMPRWLPPFQQGLFATPGQPHPTSVNNVETVANVPFILNEGATTFRSAGTIDSPGTMLFTVVGDVSSPGVYELPLGTPLPQLLVGIAGGEGTAHDHEAIAHRIPVITDQACDVPVLEQVPKIESLDDTTGEVAYNPHYHRKRSDWGYAPADAI